MLVRILYASRAADVIDDALVKSILEQSSRANPQHGITGLLCAQVEGGTFLQALEGGREAVNRLYGNIVRDPRHRDVTILEYTEIEERRFAGWRMGLVDMSKVNRGTILRYSEKASLEPFSMSGHSALALLEELADSAAIVSSEA